VTSIEAMVGRATHAPVLFQLDLVRQVVTEPVGDFRRSYRPRDDKVHSTFTLQKWRVNEGRITVTVDFSDQTMKIE
jgi:hypothetical protein